MHSFKTWIEYRRVYCQNLTHSKYAQSVILHQVSRNHRTTLLWKMTQFLMTSNTLGQVWDIDFQFMDIDFQGYYFRFRNESDNFLLSL